MKKFAYPFIFILLILGLAKSYFHLQAQEQVQEIINKAASFVQIKYLDLDVELNGNVLLQDVSVNSLEGKPLMKLKEVLIHDYEQRKGIDSRLDIELKELHFKASKSISANPYTLYNLGYYEITSDLRLGYQYSEFSKTLFLNISAKFAGIGNGALKLEFANVDPEQWRYYLRDPSSILLVRAELDYQDVTLVKNIIKTVAKMNHQTTDDVFEEIEAKMNFYQHQMKDEDEKSKWQQSVLEKWVQFLKQPERFRFKAHIKEGISFRKLRSLTAKDNVPKLLGMTFELPEN